MTTPLIRPILFGMHASWFTRLTRYRWQIAFGLLLTVLVVKYGLPLVRFSLPLGYDPGMYRYLFLRYAEGWPPFILPDLLPWAKEHSMGLFLFTTPLIKAGLPVDWLTGWIWNTFSVALLCLLSWVVSRREGSTVGLLVLLMGLLSQAYFDGFYAMYWKTYLALFFLILCFDALERWSPLAILWALLTLISHTQTGLILGLSLLSSWAWQAPVMWRDRRWRRFMIALGCVALISLLFYLPQWDNAVRSPLLSIFLLRGDQAPGGSFPETLFYVRVTGILLALGIGGFLNSLRQKRGTLWQFAVLWCALFIVFRLVFYRRFYLQLDFFLLPFAALAVRDLWRNYSMPLLRVALIVLLLVQGAITFSLSLQVRPDIAPEVFAIVKQTSKRAFPEHATIISLDNTSAPWLLGWMPDYRIGAPGLFDTPGWTYAQWEQALYGDSAARRSMLESLPADTFFLETPVLHEHYKEAINPFLADPCLEVVVPHVLRVSCAGQDRLVPAT